jgi:O-antigen ligase
MIWLHRLSRVADVLVGTLLVLLLLMPGLYLQVTTHDSVGEPREALAVIIAWGLIAAVGVSHALAGRPVFGTPDGSWARRLAWVLMAWIPLSAWLGCTPDISWRYAVSVVSFLLCAQAIVSWLAANAERSRLIVGGIASVVTVQAIVGAAQFYKLPLLQWAKAVPIATMGDRSFPFGYLPHDFLYITGVGARDGYPTGTLGNHNFMAELLVITLPVLWTFALSTPKRSIRWMGAFVLLVPTFVLIGTGTRAAIVGLAIAAVAAAVTVFGLAALDPRRAWGTRSGRIGLLGGAVVAAGLLAAAGGAMVSKFSALSLSDQSVAVRLLNWQAAWGLWLERPIAGLGLGGFKQANQAKLEAMFLDGLPALANERLIQAHNEPLQILVELGLIGFVMASALSVCWWREVRRNERLSALQRFGVLWAVGALAVASCFGFPLRMPVTALMVVVVGALGLLPGAPSGQSGLRPAWRPLYALTALVVVGAAGGLVIHKWTWPSFIAFRHEYAGKTLLDSGRYSEAAVVLRVANRVHRYAGESLLGELQALVNAKRYDDAVRLYDDNERLGINKVGLFWKGYALEQLGRPVLAKEAYEQLVHYFGPEHPDSVRATKQIQQLTTLAGKDGTARRLHP